MNNENMNILARIARRVLGRASRVDSQIAANSAIVAGWESSGSTFVYQVLTSLGVDTKKRHGRQLDGRRRVLFTIRDPRDVICSRSLRYYKDDWRERRRNKALLSALDDFVRSGYVEDLYKSVNQVNAIILRYETFFHGQEFILIKLLADLFGKGLDDENCRIILDRHSLEANRQESEQYDDFAHYDKDSLIHGHHITSGGRIGSWKEVFTPEVTAAVKERLGPALVRLGYSTADDLERARAGE